MNGDGQLDRGGRRYRRGKTLLVQSFPSRRHHTRIRPERIGGPWSVDGLEREMSLSLTSINTNRRKILGVTVDQPNAEKIEYDNLWQLDRQILFQRTT